MAMRDEIRRERQAYFATATTKEKLGYLLHYYGPTALLISAILAFLVYCVVQLTGQPESILNGTFVNLGSYGTEDRANDLAERFMKDQNIDTSKYDAEFGSNLAFIDDGSVDMQSDQTFVAQVSANLLDFVVSDYEHMLSYGYEQFFYDLTTILTEEQIEKYKPYFLYVDRTVITEKENVSLDNLDMKLPDCTKPEEMDDPIPVFILISDSDIINDLYEYRSEKRCIAFLFNGKNLEKALDFFEYIMDEK